MRRHFFSLPLLGMFVLPLLLSIYFSLIGIFDQEAWTSLFEHPQIWPATFLSVFTGLISTIVSLIIACFIVARFGAAKLFAVSGAMIALPHLAFAIGFSFVIMPSGFLARLFALISGDIVPPHWVTTHDPYGFSLIAVLILKEIPFLVWILASQLRRDDVQNLFMNQRSAALSLGHDNRSIWLRLFLPQLLPKILWPIFIVFVYSATVVDVAMVIGPTQPPTLALIVWSDLNDAQIFNVARGGVGAVFLTFVVAGVAALIWLKFKAFSRFRSWMSAGPSSQKRRFACIVQKILGDSFWVFSMIYLAIIAVLIVLSLAPLWPYPKLWPQTLSLDAWLRVWQQPFPLMNSVTIAVAATITAIVVILVWLENLPPKYDWLILVLSAITLGLPSILLSVGQYRAGLHFGISGTLLGMFIVHFIPVTAYMFIVLAKTYRAFDGRWQSSATGLMAGYYRFLWTIKFPLLKAPILAACAVGFSVSFVQYVPAQLLAAGRFSTLPMEAVTLTSGSNRPLTSAFALLLMIPPIIVFLAASYFSKSRWK